MAVRRKSYQKSRPKPERHRRKEWGRVVGKKNLTESGGRFWLLTRTQETGKIRYPSRTYTANILQRSGGGAAQCRCRVIRLFGWHRLSHQVVPHFASCRCPLQCRLCSRHIHTKQPPYLLYVYHNNNKRTHLDSDHHAGHGGTDGSDDGVVSLPASGDRPGHRLVLHAHHAGLTVELERHLCCACGTFSYVIFLDLGSRGSCLRDMGGVGDNFTWPNARVQIEGWEGRAARTETIARSCRLYDCCYSQLDGPSA